MNERIKELAEQCWDRRLDGLHFDQEKFAELIVQECVNVLHDNELWSRDVSHVLAKHFGNES